ncbi:MAG: glycosyltransferase family 9 protein [Prevotellaceae bacterium]|jgi:heptosyltransferase-2|nr:glycosyltransferase family 9 protein [Prevotellaceae bacterium]
MTIKYLVIRFGSIGDLVLTTPIIRLLKTRRPHAEIHLVTKKKFADVLAPNPHIYKIHVLEDSLIHLIKELRHEHFDFVLDLHRNFRSWLVKMALGEKTFAFYKLRFAKWLLVNFKVDILPDNLHVVDRYMGVLSDLHVKNDKQGLDFFTPRETTLPAEVEKYFEGKNFVALILSARHATKKMPTEKIVELCNKINSPVALLGSEKEREEGNFIAEKCLNVYNTCGHLNIYQSAILIDKSKVVISPESDLMQVAAARKKDVVSVWGNTVPKFGKYPYYAGKNSKIVEVENLKCRPCSRKGFQKCPKGHFDCMMQQDYAGMAMYVNSLLTKEV